MRSTARGACTSPPAAGSSHWWIRHVVLGLDRLAGTAERHGQVDVEASVTVGEARPDGRSSPQSYVVDVQLARADERHPLEVLVVEEGDGFRACGQR